MRRNAMEVRKLRHQIGINERDLAHMQRMSSINSRSASPLVQNYAENNSASRARDRQRHLDESGDFSGVFHNQLSTQRNYQRKGVLSVENYNRDAFVDVNGSNNRVGLGGDLFDNRKNSYQMMNESRSAFLMNRGSQDRSTNQMFSPANRVMSQFKQSGSTAHMYK